LRGKKEEEEFQKKIQKTRRNSPKKLTYTKEGEREGYSRRENVRKREKGLRGTTFG